LINCGITGHRGNLGKKFQVVAKNFKFKKFKGDIRKVKDIEYEITEGIYEYWRD